MKIFSYIIILLLSVITMSCGSLMKTQDVKTMDISNNNVHQTPLITDLDIKSEKVEGKAIGSATNISRLKDWAVSDALSKANADILIEPVYSIVTKSTKTEVSVIGWPANYKNFRKISKADSKILRLENNNIIESTNGVSRNKQSNDVKKQNKKVETNKKIAKVGLVLSGVTVITIIITMLAM